MRKQLDIAIAGLLCAFLIWWFLFAPAHATEKDERGNYCDLYAREMVRGYIRTVPPASVADVTIDAIRFRLNQYYTACMNDVDHPLPWIKDLPPDDKWISDEWSSLQGKAPAADPPPPPLPPVRVAAVASNGKDQAVCLRAKMRTVYIGKSWRCQK